VNATNAQHVEAKIDPETGKVNVFAEKEVVEVVQDSRTEVALDDALKVDKEAKLGGMVIVETTPHDFGRVAAQTARQVIQQRIREAERDAQLNYFNKQLGEIVSGVIQAISSQAVTLGLDMKAEGIMPRNQQIGGERFRLHDRVRALLSEVKSTAALACPFHALTGTFSAALENEVPEIYTLSRDSLIAREPDNVPGRCGCPPGRRRSGGSMRRDRGVRIQAIVPN
jgi:N utilization substance protein A